MVVPPLRERKEDIPALIETFIADFNRRNDGKIQGLSPQALTLIMQHDWPGNVRELKNAIESAAILASGETIGSEAFTELAGSIAPERSYAGPSTGALSLTVGTTLAKAERELIAATLARFKSRRETARVLGIGLRTLYTKLRQYRIRTPEPAKQPK